MENIVLTLKEKADENKEDVTYESIMEDVEKNEHNMDDFVALELHYFTNFTVKELERIGGYYDLARKRRKKEKYVNDIVCFEQNFENEDIVYRRKQLWSYLEELMEDNYLSKFIVLH